jgi:hypothetical protein
MQPYGLPIQTGCRICIKPRYRQANPPAHYPVNARFSSNPYTPTKSTSTWCRAHPCPCYGPAHNRGFLSLAQLMQHSVCLSIFLVFTVVLVLFPLKTLIFLKNVQFPKIYVGLRKMFKF